MARCEWKSAEVQPFIAILIGTNISRPVVASRTNAWWLPAPSPNMYMRMCVHKSVHMSTRMSVCMSTHKYMLLSAHMPRDHTMSMHMYIHASAAHYAHVHTHVCPHLGTHVCTYVHAYVYIHVYTHLSLAHLCSGRVRRRIGENPVCGCVRVDACVCECARVHIYISARARVCMRACAHARARVRTWWRVVAVLVHGAHDDCILGGGMFE